MYLIRSFLTFRSTTFIYFHYLFPSAGRSFMLEFLLWSFKIHLIRCFPKASVLLVICYSDFVFQERSAFLTDPEGRSVSFVDLGSWSDLLDADWYHDGFFQTTAGVRSDRGRFIFLNFFGSFDFFGRFCLLLCLCIILTWNPIDYHFSICFW